MLELGSASLVYHCHFSHIVTISLNSKSDLTQQEMELLVITWLELLLEDLLRILVIPKCDLGKLAVVK